MQEQHHPISCQQCRHSHIKCDKVLPQCSQCTKSGKMCIYVPSKRTRSSSTTTEQQSNKRQKTSSSSIHLLTTNQYISNIIGNNSVIQQIVQFYRDELASFWSFIPSSLLNPLVVSSSDIILPQQQQLDHTIADFDTRVNIVLWNSILLFALYHLPMAGSGTCDVKEFRQKVKDICQLLYTKCESILLQNDIHRAISVDNRLAWAISFIANYLLCFEDKACEARIWIGAIDAYLKSVSDPDTELEIQFYTLKWLDIANDSCIHKPFNYKQLLKMLRLTGKVLKFYESIRLLTDVPVALEDRFSQFMVIIETCSKNNSITRDELQKMINLVYGMILHNDTPLSGIYHIREGLLQTTLLAQNLYLYGIVLDVLLIESTRDTTGKLPDLLIIQRTIADCITSSILSKVSLYLNHGIMQLRPLLLAAAVHVQYSQSYSSDRSVIEALRPFIVTDIWILESLQAKYELPATASSVIFQLKQQLTICDLQLQLPQSTLLTIIPNTEFVTIEEENDGIDLLQLSPLPSSTDDFNGFFNL
jgi:hypothetical protein